jgi:hypothetical protein
MIIGDEGRPQTTEEIARAEVAERRYREALREQEYLLRRCRDQAPGATFARVVLGLRGYYVMVLAPHEGWLYGATRPTSEEAVTSFQKSGPVRVEASLPQVRYG